MDFQTFLELAKLYNGLGASVQDQLDDVMSGEPPPSELNPNALRYILKFVEAVETEGIADEDSFHVRHNITSHLESNETNRTV